MGFRIEAIDPVSRLEFGGKVTGIDLNRPLSDELREAIDSGMDRFGVLVFPSQGIDNDALYRFSTRFGTLKEPVSDVNQRNESKIGRLSNIDASGKPLPANDPKRQQTLASRLWHTDSSFRPVLAKYSFLAAERIPKVGGDTEFADMRAAFDALTQEQKREVESLVCEHGLRFCREAIGVTAPFAAEGDDDDAKLLKRPLVRMLPGSRRKALYFGIHAGRIVGWPLPDSRLFLQDLTEHATQREFVYRHVWHDGDVVMWDNRSTLHRARPFDERQARTLHRATVLDDSGWPSRIELDEGRDSA